MDTIAAVKFYLNRMVEECGDGMKVLLMDKETISIVSMVFAQSEMLQKEVYLFERLDSNRSEEPMKYLRCIVFLRPTEENIDLLRKELKRPRFGQYHIYFSNIISKTDVKLLAESDEYEVVKDVQEYYADYVAVSPQLFSINLSESAYNGNYWNSWSLQRSTQGVMSLLLSLKRNPAIRYQASSEMSKRLAETIRHSINKERSLFDFKTKSNDPSQSTLLLILDRKLDPVTPLLNQWTYQAMLHELLVISNNRVNLSEVPGVPRDLKEVVLSREHDEFYERNMYLNYGEIGQNIKELMDEFQAKTKNQQKVETIADMKTFIESYPQFKKMSGTVSKHVTIIGELSRLISAYNLFEVSEAEQELACQADHAECLRKVRRLIAHEKVRQSDSLRLVMLYALRFEKNSNHDIQGLIDMLKRKGLSEKHIKLVHQILDFAGTKGQLQSTADLLTTENMKSFTKKMIKGLKGVENIYTQHSPQIRELFEDLFKGRLRETQFPYLETTLRDRPQEVIVFIVGGVTYEESRIVNLLNKNWGTKIILGSTTIHNFKSFTDDIRSASMSSTLSAASNLIKNL